MQNKNRMLRVFVSCTMLILSVQGFSQELNTFQGLMIKIVDSNQSKEQFVSFDDLKAFRKDSVLARGRTEDSEKTWIGTPIKNVLASYDLDWRIVQKLTVSAPDGYMSVLTGDMLKDLEHGLFAYQIQDVNKLPEQIGGMRVLFPNLHAMTWVNGPDKITIQIDDKQENAERYLIYPPNHKIFNHLIKYKSDNPRIKLHDVLASYGFSTNNFIVLTQDSLYREYQVNKIIQHMMISRNDHLTWAIDGVKVPTGLRTRDIVFLSGQQAGLLLKNLTDEEWDVWIANVIPKHFGEDLGSVPVIVSYLIEGESGPVLAEMDTAINHRKDLKPILKSLIQDHSNLEYISIQAAITEAE